MIEIHTMSVLGTDKRINLQVWVCEIHTATYSISNTVCMNLQRESRLYSPISNHSNSDQNYIKEGEVQKMTPYHFWHDKSQIIPRVHPSNLH